MTVLETLADFHFLRPWWLLSIVPASVLVWLLWRHQGSSGNWAGAISDRLLDYLSDGMRQRQSRLPLYGLWLAWVLAAVALAGPTWNKLPQPVHQRQDALVVVLDLSLSMLAEDIQPSRLERARHKVQDVLDRRREGVTALVAYSGDAHVVAPFTDDTPTIANLVPALSPLMMPVVGSDPVAAMDLARELFSNAGIGQGRILLITDGITQADLDELGDSLQRRGLALSILGVGTPDGAPIPADRGFLKDKDGNIIVPQLKHGPLEELAANNGGRYTEISLNNDDIRFLLPASPLDMASTVITEREFDQWKDRGPWVALLLIPLALAAFRRGWVLTLLLPLTLTPETGRALEWQDLWQRPDQQGAEQLQAGDPESAARRFEDPAWKGSAYYRAEDYDSAARQFAGVDTAMGHYNRGNALARAGKLEQAIEAYDQALKHNPDLEDARFNRDLVQKLLKQQQQKQQQGQRDGEGERQRQSDQSAGQQQQGQGQQANAPNREQQSSSSQARQSPSEQSSGSGQQDQQQRSPEQEASQAPRAENRGQDTEQSASPATAQQAENAQQQEASKSAQQQPLSPQEQQRRQATEQWLRQVPDDPSGLLRRKFKYESRLRRQQGERQREQPKW